MPTVLSTKSLTSSQKNLLLNSGIGLVEYDAIKLEDINFSWNPNFANHLIFTSKNAVKSVFNSIGSENIKKSFIFCVGEKTRDLIQGSGLKVKECEANAADLGKRIASDYGDFKFTYFCGNIRREELSQILTENNIEFKEVEVYKTSLNPKKFYQDFDGVLFYSPSGVDSYFSLNSGKPVVAFSIGKTTSAVLEKHTSTIISANKSSIENVIVQVVKYLK